MPSVRFSFVSICLLGLFIFSCVVTITNAQTTTPQERFTELQTQQAANQNGSPSTTRTSLPTARPEPSRSSSSAIQERQAQRQSALSERQYTRIQNLAANISNRMEAAIARLEQITNRLQTRIELMQAAGKNTAAAQTALTSALLDIEDAKARLRNIDTTVTNAIGSEQPRTTWTTARTKYMEARASIKSAHTNLRIAVAALKAADSDTPSVAAPTTATSTSFE